MRLRAWRCPPCRRAPQAGCGIRARSAGGACCRTPRHKTHNTAVAAEVVVAYSWHPWAGHLVHVHEVLEREAGAWARCSLVGADVARLREIPTWMLDASICRTMRRSSKPVAALSALAALQALLTEAMEGTTAALSGAEVACTPPHRRGRHAPSPDTGAPARPLPAVPAAERGGEAGMEQPAGCNTASRGGAADPPADRPRRRR